MAGNDDIVARLRRREELFAGGTALVNPDGPDAADEVESLRTALAERDAQIERLTKDVAEASTDVEAMLTEAATLRARATTAERERDEARAEVERVKNVLEEGRRAVGDHFAPNDCYATGPMTGDHIRDLVECPACSFLALYDKYKARAALQQSEVKP